MADSLPRPVFPTETGQQASSLAELLEERAAQGEIALSPLGRRLLNVRRRIENSGIPLLDYAELEHEKAERRGGIESRSACYAPFQIVVC